MSSYKRGRQNKLEVNLTSSFIAGGYQYTHHNNTLLANYRFEENKKVDKANISSLTVNDHSGYNNTATISTASMPSTPAQDVYGDHLAIRTSVTTPYEYSKNTLKKSGLTDDQRLLTAGNISGEQIRVLQFPSGTAERIELPDELATQLSSIKGSSLPRDNLFDKGLTFAGWIRLDSNKETYSIIADGTTLENEDHNKSVFTTLYGDKNDNTIYNNIGLSLRVTNDESSDNGRLTWIASHRSGSSNDIETYRWHTQGVIPTDQWAHVCILYPTASNITSFAVNNKTAIRPNFYINGEEVPIIQEPRTEPAVASIDFAEIPFYYGVDPDGFYNLNLVIDIPSGQNELRQSLIRLESRYVMNLLPGTTDVYAEYVPHEANITLTSDALDSTQTGLDNHLATFRLTDPITQNTQYFVLDMYSTCSIGNFCGFENSPQRVNPNEQFLPEIDIVYRPENAINAYNYNPVVSSSIRLTTPNMTSKVYQFVNENVGGNSVDVYDEVLFDGDPTRLYISEPQPEMFVSIIPKGDNDTITNLDTKFFTLKDNTGNIVTFTYDVNEEMAISNSSTDYVIGAQSINNQKTHTGALYDALLLAHANGDLFINFASCSKLDIENNNLIPVVQLRKNESLPFSYITPPYFDTSDPELTFDIVNKCKNITSTHPTDNDFIGGFNTSKYYAITNNQLAHGFVIGSQVKLSTALTTQNAYNYTQHIIKDSINSRNSTIYKPFDGSPVLPVISGDPIFIFGTDDSEQDHGKPVNFRSRRYIQTTRKFIGNFTVSFKAYPADNDGNARVTTNTDLFTAPESSTHGLHVQISPDGYTWYGSEYRIQDNGVYVTISTLGADINNYVSNYRNLTNGGRESILPGDFSTQQWQQFKFYHDEALLYPGYRGNEGEFPGYYIRIIQESYDGYDKNNWALADVHIIGQMDSFLASNSNSNNITRVKMSTDVNTTWSNFCDAVNSDMGHNGEIAAEQSVVGGVGLVKLKFRSPLGILTDGITIKESLINSSEGYDTGLSYAFYNNEIVTLKNIDYDVTYDTNTHYRIGLKNATVENALERIRNVINGIQDVETGLDTIANDTDYLRIKSATKLRSEYPEVLPQPYRTDGTICEGWSVSGYDNYVEAVSLSMYSKIWNAISNGYPIDHLGTRQQIAQEIRELVNKIPSLGVRAIIPAPDTTTTVEFEHLESNLRSNDPSDFKIRAYNGNMLDFGYTSYITLTDGGGTYSQFSGGLYDAGYPRGDLVQSTCAYLGTPPQLLEYYWLQSYPFGYDNPESTYYDSYQPHLFGITPLCYLDDVSFWTRCLDHNEILALYNARRGVYDAKSGISNGNPRIALIDHDNASNQYPTVRRPIYDLNANITSPYDANNELLANQSYSAAVITFTGAPSAYIRLVDWEGNIKTFHFTERFVQSTSTNIVIKSLQNDDTTKIAERFVDAVNNGGDIIGFKFGIHADLIGKKSVLLRQTKPTSDGNMPIITGRSNYANRPFALNAIVPEQFTGGSEKINSVFPIRRDKNNKNNFKLITSPNSIPMLDIPVDNDVNIITDYVEKNHNMDDPFIEDGQYESYQYIEHPDLDISQININEYNRNFYLTGTDPEHVGYGLSAPLTSKHKIIIDVNPVDKTKLYKHITTGSTMAYFNFETKLWECLGNEQTGSYRLEPGGSDVCASLWLDFDQITDNKFAEWGVDSTSPLHNGKIKLIDARGKYTTIRFSDSKDSELYNIERVNENNWIVPTKSGIVYPNIMSNFDQWISDGFTADELDGKTLIIKDSLDYEQTFRHSKDISRLSPELEPGPSNVVLIGVGDVSNSADHLEALYEAIMFALYDPSVSPKLSIDDPEIVDDVLFLKTDGVQLVFSDGGKIKAISGTAVGHCLYPEAYFKGRRDCLAMLYTTLSAILISDDLAIQVVNPTSNIYQNTQTYGLYDPDIPVILELRQLIQGKEGNTYTDYSDFPYFADITDQFIDGDRFIGISASEYSIMSQSLDSERYGESNLRKWMDTVHIGFSPSMGLSVKTSSDVLLDKLSSNVQNINNEGKYLFDNGGLASPISTFGFPIHPKYQAKNNQYINVSDYIDRPFLLEKIVYEFNADVYESASIQTFVAGDPTVSSSYGSESNYEQTAQLNIPTPTFFILNQRRCVFPDAFANSINVANINDLDELTKASLNYSSSIPSLFSLPNSVDDVNTIDTTRDLVTFAKFSLLPGSYSIDDFEQYCEDIRGKTDLALVTQDSKTGWNNAIYTGSTTTLTFPVRSPKSNNSICTFKTEGDFLAGPAAQYVLEVADDIESTFVAYSDIKLQDSSGLVRQIYFVKDISATTKIIINSEKSYDPNDIMSNDITDIIGKVLELEDVEGNIVSFIFETNWVDGIPRLVSDDPKQYSINITNSTTDEQFAECIHQSIQLAYNNGDINIDPGTYDGPFTSDPEITLTMSTKGIAGNNFTITGNAIGIVNGNMYIRTPNNFSGGFTYDQGIGWYTDFARVSGYNVWICNCTHYDTPEDMCARIYESISIVNNTSYSNGGFKDPFILQDTGSAHTKSFSFRQSIGGLKSNMTMGFTYKYTTTPTLYDISLTSSGTQSNDELLLEWGGGRCGTMQPTGRAVFGGELSSTNIAYTTINPNNTCVISHSYDDSSISPYLIVPGDKLIFGWQSPIASGSDLYHGEYDENNIQPGSLELMPGAGRIVLYGSLLCNDEQKQNVTSNQKLTSNTIHEALYSDADVYDIFDSDPYYYHANSSFDELVTGSMLLGERGVVSRASSGTHTYTPNDANDAIINKRYGFLRCFKSYDENEQFYDSMVPVISELMAKDNKTAYSPAYINSNSQKVNSEYAVILLGHPSLNRETAALTNSSQDVINHYTSIWSNWMPAYPFEPRYSGVLRTSRIKTRESMTSTSGSYSLGRKKVGAVWLVNAKDSFTDIDSNDDSDVSLDMLNIIERTTLLSQSQDDDYDINGRHQPFNIQHTVLTNNDGFTDINQSLDEVDIKSSKFGTNITADDEYFAKLFFGAGNKTYKFPSLPYWKTSRIKPGQGYSPSETMITARGIVIRGFRYGLCNLLPTYSSVIYRREHFGHLRDMMEQRLFTRYFTDNNTTEGPIQVTFVERGTERKIDPESTNSSNLDIYCTSSMPYSDGLYFDRSTMQPDLLQKVNVSFDVGIIK